jgi:hypothetical protein
LRTSVPDAEYIQVNRKDDRESWGHNMKPLNLPS